MFKRIILPASILAGTIIGAGVFSLPFVFQSAGLFTGLIYLIVFSVIFILIYFCYADIILRTSGQHRFPGYARIYLGNWAFWLGLVIGVFQLIFVLTIYLILAPSFSGLLLPGNHSYHLLFFWLVASAAILLSVRRIALLESLIIGGTVLIMIIIFFLGFKPSAFQSLNFSLSGLFQISLAGSVIFALSGVNAIPEAVAYFKETKTLMKFLKPAILLGAIVPATAYFLFVIGVLGLSPTVSENTVSGLIGSVSPMILSLIGVLGYLSVFSSYLVIGLNARRMLQYDFAIPARLTELIVIFAPLTLYLSGFKYFLKSVTFVGAVFLPLEIIFIILIWLRMRKSATITLK